MNQKQDDPKLLADRTMMASTVAAFSSAWHGRARDWCGP